jgi:hypothetical protein
MPWERAPAGSPSRPINTLLSPLPALPPWRHPALLRMFFTCALLPGQVSVRYLRAVEGTVLLHINSAAKHDPLLVKELVRRWRAALPCRGVPADRAMPTRLAHSRPSAH